MSLTILENECRCALQRSSNLFYRPTKIVAFIIFSKFVLFFL